MIKTTTISKKLNLLSPTLADSCKKQKTSGLFKRSLILSVFLLMLANLSWGQTVIYSDDFNRATLAGGTYTYTATNTPGTATGSASIISSTILQIVNGTAVNGKTSVSVTPSGAGFSSTLDNCTGLVTWTFNMRFGRTSLPSGFAAGSYGNAFVLASDNAEFANAGAKGYAILFGNSGTPDPFRLVAFNAGITADYNTIGSTAGTTLISGTGIFSTTTQTQSNDYYSFKVTYDPATKIWSFLGRDDGATAFADPALGTLTSIGTFTETTAIYRATALGKLGGMWNYSTGATGNNCQFDNFKLTVTASTSPTIKINGNSSATATAFTTTYGTFSSAQTFAITGTNLTADITATAPTGFEVSNGGAYGASTTFTQTGGSASGTLSVRLKATAAVTGTYNSITIPLTSSGASTVNITTAASGNIVTAAALTITGVSAVNKTYDATTTATLTGTAGYSGLQNSETFTVTGTPVANFNNKNVGNAKPVTITGYTAPSTNYTVTQPSSAANVSTATLTISNPAAQNKIYDGNTNAVITGTLSGVLLSDVVSLSGTGTFDNTGPGNAIPVTSTSTLTGTDAGNYTLTQPTGLSANILPLSSPTITINGSAAATAAAFTTTYGTPSTAQTFTIGGTNLTADITVTAPAGFEVSNGGAYGTTTTFIQSGGNASGTLSVRLQATAGVTGAYNSLSIPLTSTGAPTVNITTAASGNSVSAAPLTISGVSAVSKIYDATTAATLSGTPAYSGLQNGESFSVTGTPVATFNNINAGTAKPVTLTGYTAPSTNYTVSQPTGLTADISQKGITIGGVTANNKVFDGTTAATLSGTATPVGVVTPADNGLVSITGTPVATFASSAIANNIAVTVTGYTLTLTGTATGNYVLTSQPTGLTANITPVPTLTEVILPQYIQGLNGTNSNRLPFAYRATLSNLNPNATYRYYGGLELTSAASNSSGAGTNIFPDPSVANSFVYSTTLSLSTAGGYGTFTTDANGSYTGWFILVPTGNGTRFIPGNNLLTRITLNNGAGGTTTATVLSSTNTVTVINLVNAAGATNGTGLRGNSSAIAKNFVFAYDNTSGSGRPISGTFVESDGAVETASFAAFYTASVDGVAGAYGMVVPNTLPNGIRRIEQRDFTTGNLVGCAAMDADGAWPSGANTVNPTGGTTAIVITSTDAPLSSSVNITTSTTGTGSGAISPAGPVSVTCGSNQTFNIAPTNSCSIISDVLVDGVSQGAVTTYTFTNVQAPHTISASFAMVTYTVTASAGTGGSITASNTHNCGTSPVYTITPDACHTIADVLVDGVSQGAISSFIFTSIAANHIISASFNLITYTVTASAGTNGSITATNTYNCGTSPVYTITPDACYSIADVLVDGFSQGAISNFTFTNIAANHTISASFSASPVTPAVSLSALPLNAIICSGTNVTFTATPTNGGSSPNYEFFLNNVSVQNGSSNTYANNALLNGDSVYSIITSNHPCASPTTATSAAIYVQVTTSVNAAVSLSSNAPANTICVGTNVTFTATPTNGGGSPNYEFLLNNVTAQTGGSNIYSTSALVNGDSVYVKMTSSNACAVPNISTSAAVYTTVNTSFTITASAGTNGSITAGGSVACGSSPVYTITPDACYQVADVIVDGNSVGAVTSYAFSNVTANHSISATFSQITYTVTATAGANGSITATNTYNCGTSPVYTITPDACYQIANVIVDNVSQGAISSFTFTSIAANHSISATFSQITYTITTTAGANGTITAGGSVVCGSSPTYTITPSNGYSVSDVLVDNVSEGFITSRTFNNVSANHSIAVTFAADYLTFNGIPTTGYAGTSLTSFTVEVRKADGTIDAGFSGNISVTGAGPGTLSGTLSQPTVNGVATFGNLSFNNVGTYTITASSGVVTNVTSGNIVISLLPFIAGNIVVDRIGDGSATLSSAAWPVFLDQYNYNTLSQAAPVASYKFPSTTPRPTQDPFNLMETGTATGDGYITRSNDGSIIVVPGYNGIPGDLNIPGSVSLSSGSPQVLRTIGVADANGILTTATGLDMMSGTSFRSVGSDGSQLWAAGSAGGLVYIPYIGSPFYTTIWAGNARALSVQYGQLYASSASKGFNSAVDTTLGIWKVGNGLPSSALVSSDISLVVPTGNAPVSPFAFSFNPTQDICYIADERAYTNSTNTGTGGIQKWVKGTNGIFSKAYVIRPDTGTSTAGARGIVVDYSGTNPVIYATTTSGSNNKLIKVIDTGAGSTSGIIAAAGNNKVFRGVAFAPQQGGILTVNSVGFTNNFGIVSIGYSSASSSFTVSGSSLANPLTITPPAGFEIRIGANAFSSAPIIIVPSGGFLAAQIDVRFTPSAVGPISGIISLASAGAVTQQLTVSGTGQTYFPPDHLAITTVTPTNPLKNFPFSVEIRSQDNLNQNQNVTVNTPVTLALTIGTGSLTGVLTGTIFAGSSSVTLTSLNYDTEEDSIQVTASASGLLSGSKKFNVLGYANHLAFANIPTTAVVGQPFPYFTGTTPTPFFVNALRSNNSIDPNWVQQVNLTAITLPSGTATMTGPTSAFPVNGGASFSNFFFNEPGDYVIQATSDILPAITTTIHVISPPIVADKIYPRYAVHGASAGSRAPFVCRLQLNGLSAGATYRYITSATNGVAAPAAGNMFVVNNTPNSYGYITGYTSSKALSGVLLDGNQFSGSASYGQFTTDNTGKYEGWFALVPTGNAVFGPGKNMYVGITINDGQGGTAPITSLISNNYALMLEPSNVNIDTAARAIRGTSYATPENMIFLYDQQGGNGGTGRPIWGTWAEMDSISTNFTSWYYPTVDTLNSGSWGAYIPSNLTAGVQRIEQRSVATGDIIGCPALDDNGIWPSGANTVLQAGGISPIVITTTDAGLGETYTITTNPSANGSITSTGSYACGSSPVYFILADICYQTTDVIVDGVSVGAVGSYTFNNLSANHTITATFTRFYSPACPLCGPYTVGGATPDFVDVNEAITALNASGISCPVTFNIRTGSYAAGQTINAITGSSTVNTVTFQAESGVAADVTLTASDNGIVLNNAGNLVFNKLTFSVSSMTGAASGVFVNPYTLSPNVVVSGCAFNVSAPGNISYGIYNYYSETAGLQVTGNTFNNVNDPVYIYGYPPYVNDNISVTDNIMTGAQNGVYGYSIAGIDVSGNQINVNGASGSASGVYLYYVPLYNIQKNKITSNNSTGNINGIYVYYCDGTPTANDSIINNFITIDGTATSNGIYLFNASYLNVLHNSVNVINTNPSSSAYYRRQGNHIDVTNNILVNTGGGYAIYVTNIDPTIDYDFNDYYVTGPNLGNEGGTNAVDLAAWQALYGLDTYSISVDPGFTSATDLHVSNAALNGAGEALGIVDDIDGDLRNLTNPDIGADEFNVNAATLNLRTFIEGWYIPGGTMQQPALTNGDNMDPSNCDSITVELRDAVDPSIIVAHKTTMMNNMGYSTVSIPGLSTGTGINYWIGVYTRNCIEAWSNGVVPFLNQTLSYDFTTSDQQVLGQVTKEVEPGVAWALVSGDCNQDGTVDGLDLGMVEIQTNNFVNGGYLVEDVNGDTTADGLDLGIVEINTNGFWSKSTPY